MTNLDFQVPPAPSRGDRDGLRILLVTVMPPSPHGHGAIPLLLNATLRALERHSVTLLTVAGPEQCHLDAVEELRTVGVEVLACVRREPSGLARWQRRWSFASCRLGGA
ncbi:MAG: hypothetical protein ACM3JD_17560, partial [Rudaea sp.]